tara:strand:- start:1344 stop:1880 length:537 start_codon:yes stop_codon:yes gene_type:complete
VKLKEIEKLVTSVTNVNINSKSRQRRFVEARGVYYKVCREVFKYNLYTIGKSLGFGHATVMYALKNFKYWRYGNPKLISDYDKVLNLINIINSEEDEDENVFSRLISLQSRNKALTNKIEMLKKQNLHAEENAVHIFFMSSFKGMTTDFLLQIMRQEFILKVENKSLHKLIYDELSCR